MDFSPDLLSAVVDHARRELRRMEAGEVPAPLRRVAAASGPKLAPPLARRLITEIDQNDWLRERLAETWDGEPEEPGSLFLVRPDGWQERLGELAAQTAASRDASRLAELERELAEARAEVEKSRRRAKRVQREAELAVAEAEKRVMAARSATKDQRQSGVEGVETLRREVAQLRRTVEELSRDLESSRERVRGLRSELLRTRRAARPQASGPAAAGVWSGDDPLHRARLLDEIRSAFAPAVEFVEPQLPLEETELELPVGTRPDDRSGVLWLLSVERPLVLIVDGYNVTHLLHSGRGAEPAARERLNRDLARLRRLATQPMRVVVVYDSSVAGGTTVAAASGGVEVRFTADGRTADDEVLDLAAELGAAAAVVSSDRRVREGAERLGALGLWSESLVDWIRSG